MAIDAGAQECKSNYDFHEIQCSKNDIYNVKRVRKKINNFISTDIEWVPLNNVIILKEKQEELLNFFEILEDDDDVKIYIQMHNLLVRLC